jgi:hypothetical protein
MLAWLQSIMSNSSYYLPQAQGILQPAGDDPFWFTRSGKHPFNISACFQFKGVVR